MTELRCFGSPALLIDGSPAALGRKKTLALVVYLAVTGRPCSRETLAALLWPDNDAAHAFGYLRTALYELTTAVGSSLVTTDRHSLGIGPSALEVDVARFRALSTDGSTTTPGERDYLEKAVDLRRDGFLRGFSLKDAPGFDDWQRQTSEELDGRCRDALTALVRTCVRDGDLPAAVERGRQLVGLDELDEGHHRLLMRVLALAGRHGAAEAQFERCRRALERELNVPPTDETRRLRDRVRAARNDDDADAFDRMLREEIVAPRRPGPAARPHPPMAPPRSDTRPPAVLCCPAGVFVDQANRIYIADTGNHRIVRIDDMNGSGAVSVGSQGTGVSEFLSLSSVWVDAAGRIHACDAHAHRICRIDDMDGGGWISFGSKGGGTGEFSSPHGVCVDPLGRILVADTLNARLVRTDDMNGAGWVTLEAAPRGVGPDRFASPGAVYVDASGWIYVANTAAGTIIRLDGIDGTGWSVLRPAGRSGHHFTVTGLCVDPQSDSLHIANGDGWSIMRFESMTGLDWTELHGRPGGGPHLRDSFSYPSGIALDGQGRIYVADNANDRIVRVDDISGAGWTEYPPRPG
jgi:DNA-binding SARP family transcriptional activator/DNA-binding beta-propeller fold protein YncE